MLEFEYSLTTSPKILENAADAIGAAFGEKIHTENNALVFPPSVATGKAEFYSLDLGLGLSLMDCRFTKEVKFIRKPLLINDFHILHFNLSSIPVWVHTQTGESVDVGTDWKNAVYYGTSGMGAELCPAQDGNLRMVNIIFSRAWLIKHYDIEKTPLHPGLASEFLMDQPIQFFMDLDLRLLLIAEEILVTTPPSHMQKLYYEGCAKRLVALVADRLARPVGNDEKLKFNEVSTVMAIKERVSRSLDKPLPALEDLATECVMSKTKFASLFKAIYHKNYSDYFLQTKMQKAAELLLKGSPVSEVGHAVGYNNLSHFAKAFKDYFNTTPKLYQKGAKITKV
jgi:AraC-like DNA-binding protein